MEESRKQFIEEFEEITGWEARDYPNKDVLNLCWQFWLASRAAIEITIPESFKTEMGAYGDADVITVAEMTEAIRAAGLKIKGE